MGDTNLPSSVFQAYLPSIEHISEPGRRAILSQWKIARWLWNRGFSGITIISSYCSNFPFVDILCRKDDKIYGWQVRIGSRWSLQSKRALEGLRAFAKFFNIKFGIAIISVDLKNVVWKEVDHDSIPASVSLKQTDGRESLSEDAPQLVKA